jgi:hypothetical protein
MADKNVVSVLIQERDEIIERLSKANPDLGVELKIVMRMIEKHSHNGQTQISIPFQEKETITRSKGRGKLLPISVIKEYFNNHPEQEFSPPELRKILIDACNSGEVKIKGKNISSTNHVILRMLVDNGFIRKIEREGTNPVYMKA